MAENKPNFDIDPSLLQDFLIESRESLESISGLFVQLEDNTEDHSLIDQIFRPVHSIKGNSSFFGLMNIKTFSHTFENLLQDLRSDKLKVSKSIIDILLTGVDMLINMVDRLASGDYSTDLLEEEKKVLDKVTSIRESKEDQTATLLKTSFDALDKLREHAPEDLLPEIEKVTEAINSYLSRLSPAASPAAAEGGYVNYFIDGKDATKQITEIIVFTKSLVEKSKKEEECETYISNLKDVSAISQETGKSHLKATFEDMLNDFTAIHDSGIGFDNMLAELIQEKLELALKGVTQKHQEKEAAAPKESKPAESTAAKKEQDEHVKKDTGPKSIRIDEEKVDSFMNYVGELIITSEVFSYIHKKLEGVEGIRGIITEFNQAILSFNELSNNLQKSLMEVRRVPLKNIMQKIPRIVRDLSNDLKKEVELKIDGQMIQIDKSLVEKLESPIVHMVRNCVDHAIEMPEDRKKINKPAKGTVEIIAECNEEVFTLTIKDDGKGLDAEGIKTKAVEKGQISQSQADNMTEKDIYKLIFGAGISTAKTVTEVSGRGVGMDVVRTNIEEMNGTIDIDSEINVGTTFTITLPMSLTLMVVDGLLARVGSTTYIIPIANVTESIKPKAEDISTVSGKGEVINVRGNLYPLVRLYKIFGTPPEFTDPCDTVVVIANCDGKSCAFMVDDLLGQQSVVLKELSAYFKELKIIKGGAILGSGKIGLVLDTEYIIESLLAR